MVISYQRIFPDDKHTSEVSCRKLAGAQDAQAGIQRRDGITGTVCKVNPGAQQQ